MKTESTNACPKCGAPVPPEAPQGLCPKCVLAQAVAPEPAATATANIPTFERLAAAFPQLQILELIGRGAMGFVFKARQPHLDRFVALKLLPDSLALDPHFAERFNREGRTLARLNHPNIVSVFDFGQAGGFYYLLMEYVDGVNLRQATQAGRFSPAESLAIVPKICEALQYAHEEGVLHRDIKPENILLDAKGRVKIADFGIAKIVGEDTPEPALTGTGAALGTPHYMAPEQLEKPGSVDHRADIYSLGVVFYEMLTGELPIGRFAAPSEKTPIDPRVDDVVMRTLEKEREKRFQSAGEVKTNVEHLTQAGAGSFKGAPPKSREGTGQRGTIVVGPETVSPTIPRWSHRAVWGSVLVGISLPVPLLLSILAYFAKDARGGIGGWEILFAVVAISFPGLAGTILGWMALADIRGQAGNLRGLPLAIFAALTLPLLLLVSGTLMLSWLLVYHAVGHGPLPAPVFLTLLIPAGTITFAIWSIYAAAHWGANRPSTHRRGVLKWIFLALLLFGVGALVLPGMRPVRQVHYVRTPETTEANTTPWIGFTVTAVELREEKGVRWLAIDYLDDVHGDCQKAFLRENSIPGFTPTTRSSEFVGGDTNAPVRHQRIEYRMPDSVSREQLETFRDSVTRKLNRKSFRLQMGERRELFTLQDSTGHALSAAITVVAEKVLASTTPPGQQSESVRRIELQVPTVSENQYRSVGITTFSDLPMGEYLVGLLRRPDGSTEELPAATTIYNGSKPRTMRHIIWPLSNMESNRVRELDAAMHAKLDGQVIELKPGARTRVFSVTNDRGNLVEGFVSLRSQDLTVHDLPPVTVSIVGVPQRWPYFVSVSLLVSAPPGLLPRALGLTGDDVEAESSTSIMGRSSATWAGDMCQWYFPAGFEPADIQEIIRQIESTKDSSPAGIRVLPGQRAPVFSVTNKSGMVFRGYFELPDLKDERRQPILDGWLRGAWIYDKEHSTKKTAELRTATATPQKSLQEIADGVQESARTNKGAPDVSRVAGEMAGVTAGLMLSMRDSVEQQLVLNLLTGTEMTFDSNEVRTISRLARPARMQYKEIQIVDPATVFLRYGSTNGGRFYREGERMRITDPGLPFALYFKRVTNNPEAAQP